MTRIYLKGAIAALVVAWAVPVHAQDAGPQADLGPQVRIAGAVVDAESREPARSVTVTFHRIGFEGEPAWSGFSNSDGRFTTPSLPVGLYRIEVASIAFEPLSHIVAYPRGGIIDLRMELAPAGIDYALSPIVVSVRRQTRLERTGFYNRETQGIGRFLDYDDIQSRRPRVVSDLFMGIPGARVSQGGGVTSSNIIRLRGGCVPQYILDGTPMLPPVPIDVLVPANDLEAVEVYNGPTGPMEYGGGSPCGTIMVWTRSPPEAIGSIISLKKFAFIVGFTALAVTATSR